MCIRDSNDALQRIGQLHDDLFLRAAVKNANDAFQRVRDVRRMHGGEHQMPGFRRHQCGGDGLVVADFTDNNDIRVLAQNVD